jgi:hypothetical protein
MSTFILTDTTHLGAIRPIGAYETAAEALSDLRSERLELFIEQDPDHPECWDIFDLQTGDLFTIEPEGFKP